MLLYWYLNAEQAVLAQIDTQHMLFAVDGPDEEDSLQYEAYASALMLLRQVADVLPIAHKQAVLDFARQ